jgi:Flp pilus assembly protein TadB
MKRDIINNDYLSVSVKSAQLDRILLCYSALGWSEVRREDDKKYYDMKYLLLSRPHKIENKDRLQYLQVKMETCINSLSHTNANQHRKSLTLSILLGIAALGYLAVSLLFFFAFSGTLYTVLAIVFGVCCVLNLLLQIYPFVVMRKREKKSADEKIESYLMLIDKYLQEARSLTLANVEDNADMIITVINGVRNE